MGRPNVLAQADHHHFQQTALDGAVVAGVRLDAGHDADVVGLGGVFVEIDGKALGCAAELDHLHRRPNRYADEGLGDAITFEDLLLAFGGAAAVAAHRRHQKRARAQVLQEAGNTLEHQRNVGDAATAGGQRHGLAGFDRSAQVEFFQRRADSGRDVLQAVVLEVLTQTNHFGVGHGITHVARGSQGFGKEVS